MSRPLLTRIARFAAVSLLGACGDGGTGPSDNGPATTPVVTRVVINISEVTLTSLGDTITLIAQGSDVSGNTVSGKTFTWTSSNVEVATVSTTGLVTAVANGSVTITATTDGVNGTATIDVEIVPQLLRLNPFRTSSGSGDLTIEAHGVDFTTASTFYWNGEPIPTTFVSSSQLSAVISAADLAAATVVDVTVVTDSGQTAGPLPFFVDAAEVRGRFAYVGSWSPNEIVAHRIDYLTGALNPITGGRVELSQPPRRLVAASSGRFVYAFGDSLLFWFEVDRATGILTLVGSVPSQSHPRIAMDPAAQYLFALVGGEILVYPIDPSTGSLSVAPVFRTTANGRGLVVDTSGRFLYVANPDRFFNEGGVHAFRINRGIGDLAYVGFLGTRGVGVWGGTSDRCGRRLFMTTQISLSRSPVMAFDIDPMTGTLTGPVGEIETFEGGLAAVNPSCRSLYFHSGPSLNAAAVDSTTGTLSTLNSVVLPGGVGPGVAVDPSGRYIYLISNGILTYALEPTTGALVLETVMRIDANPTSDVILVVP